ncbi:hypothetical protein [Gemmobacter sp. 24YEA27]|uniref:hypothetical protein n=1 Tax=Gemmobacter sp. 24YEA27 TaxID=3040672 RepID=UPI0024B378DF|nr:hypothetical protein [Gemmobacter sp. 24YEA27]
MTEMMQASATVSDLQVLDSFHGRDTFGLVPGAPVWLAWRCAGRQIAAGWYEAEDLAAAIALARSDLPGMPQPDALEICVTRDWQPVTPETLTTSFPNSLRGLVGMEILSGGKLTRVAPTRAIATNRAPFREIERLAKLKRITPEAYAQSARIRRFSADQFLLLIPEDRCVRLWRGGHIQPAEKVDAPLLQQTIDGLIGWMRQNLHPDGRMTYKYWPSRGAESKADNTIRQFMATVALGRIAMRSGSAADASGAQASLAYNLDRFYAEEDGLGMIIFEGKAKLGAMALAALAILEFREAGLIEPAGYEVPFAALCAGLFHLWQEDGAFRTFLKPPDRNDNQNFYPGEALLFLATLHRKTRDPDLARRCMASFRYYRDWHLADPNPAFVPWHSQACVMLWEDLGASELAEFVFSRNDWILQMQQWGGRLHPDFQGRFYNPDRPDFGPPHASSTGVYMEGLADAWRLAQRLGDAARAERYATALRRGLRAIRQLQFRDRRVDGFYISRPEAVMGGLRTEAYNNEIRVDNVQHCLMALLKLERDADFNWSGGV